MEIDIRKLPYKHCFAAASMLMSKGNRLTGLFDSPDEAPTEKQIHKICEGLSYYDIALSLLKPNDSNYQTLLNWKCLALISLGQYADAREWYRELVRIDEECSGRRTRSATAELALEQIEKLGDQENAPLPEIDPRDINVFDDPGFCRVAEDFCYLLRDGQFKRAHLFLAPNLKNMITPADLERSWVDMMRGNAADADIVLETYELTLPDAEENDVGWCYFSVTSQVANEAISMVIRSTSMNTFEIRSLDFGRP